MSNEEILQRIVDAIIAGDTPAVEAATQDGLDAGMDPQSLINDGGAKGLEIVGETFENLEMFIPELLISAETMRALNKLVRSINLSEKFARFRRIFRCTIH